MKKINNKQAKSRPEVFISYSRKDTFFADQIVQQFERMGIQYFIDRKGIAGGAEFPEVLATAITQCDIVLFIGSENSYASKFTNNEVQFAVSNKERGSVLTYIIDGTELPDSLSLLLSGTKIQRLEDLPVNALVDTIEGILRYDERKKKKSFDEGGICSSMFFALIPSIYLGFKTNILVGIAAFFLGLIAILSMGTDIYKELKDHQMPLTEKMTSVLVKLIWITIFILPVFWLWHAIEYETYIQDILLCVACSITLLAITIIISNSIWLIAGSFAAISFFFWLTWQGYWSYQSSLFALSGCHILLWVLLIATHWEEAKAFFKE
jgi:hypothetical protein